MADKMDVRRQSCKVGIFNKVDAEKYLNPGRFTWINADNIISPDALLVRSQDLKSMKFNPELLAIGRAGAGVNNIPIKACSESGIAVFNTPGANAMSVAELVDAMMVIAARNIVPAIEWCKTLANEGANVPTLVEGGKKQFAGCEINGKNLGIIGLGAIGKLIAQKAINNGMYVMYYDPKASVPDSLEVNEAVWAELLAESDIVTLNLSYSKEDAGMVGKDFIRLMRKGAVLMNFARGELIDENALIAGLDSGQISCYITDFPTARFITHPKAICIPHLGASTADAEEKCARMICEQISDYLLYGNVKNSVNFPSVRLDKESVARISVVFKDRTNILAEINSVFGNASLNIAGSSFDTRGEVGYVIYALDREPTEGLLEEISAIPDVIVVRRLDIPEVMKGVGEE